MILHICHALYFRYSIKNVTCAIKNVTCSTDYSTCSKKHKNSKCIICIFRDLVTLKNVKICFIN